MVKPAESGTATGQPSDVDVVVRLAGPATARTLASYPDPLAPLAAARLRALAPLESYAVVDAVKAEAKTHDLVLVEGAGGLLVPMGVRPGGEPWTVADLAVVARRAGRRGGPRRVRHAQPHRADHGGAAAARVGGRRGDRRVAGRAGAGALGEPRATWRRACSARCPTAPPRWTPGCSAGPRPAG